MFHYDNSYTLQDNYFSGLTNEYFVNFIDNVNPNDIKNVFIKKFIFFDFSFESK